MSESSVPTWERRFRAPSFNLPTWSRSTPDRAVVVSNESGSLQAYSWDVASGERRQISFEPVGIQTEAGIDPQPTADGTGVIWFQDETGDESGLWVVAPFEGGEPKPLLPGVPFAWPSGGIAAGHSVIAASFSTEEGYQVWASCDGEPAKLLHRHPELVDVPWQQWGGYNVAALSADETMLLLQHGEKGNYYFLELRVLDPRTGEVVGELSDHPGNSITGQAWSPVPGDDRVAFRANRSGWDRPGIWNPRTGERTDFDDLPEGEYEVFDWWPDAESLLLNRLFEGRDELLKLDIATGSTSPVKAPRGTFMGAQVRPDGSVWMNWSDAEDNYTILDDSGEVVLAPEGEPAPRGHEYRSVSFSNPVGQEVHGFVVTPPGEGPWPLAIDVHGGPEWLWADQFSPKVAALVDLGLAVLLVNYRGSIGYGRDWRDSLIGNVGFYELEDHLAGLDHVIAEGIADPDRVVLMGRSWGGYITLLGLGMHPDRFICGAAGVPVGDYVEAYVDSAPSLQAMDRALLGGAAPDKVEFVTPRSPITYVDKVRVPVHIQYGENDTRCPPRQVRLYIDALAEAGGSSEVDVYGTGHGSMIVDEDVRQWGVVLDFLSRNVPGLRPT